MTLRSINLRHKISPKSFLKPLGDIHNYMNTRGGTIKIFTTNVSFNYDILVSLRSENKNQLHKNISNYVNSLYSVITFF